MPSVVGSHRFSLFSVFSGLVRKRCWLVSVLLLVPATCVFAQTPIFPYVQVNGGPWQTTNSVTVNATDTVNLGPQPVSGGSWNWSGPDGFASSAREIDGIPLISPTNVYVASYTDVDGLTSNQAFTITVNSTPVVPMIQDYGQDGGAWQNVSSVTVNYADTVNLGPQPVNGGTWSWTGPNGFTSTSRQINGVPLPAPTNIYTATYTNPAGVTSTQAFAIAVNSTPIAPYLEVDGTTWQNAASAAVNFGDTVNLGPQPISGGTWNWTGPNGFTSSSREIDNVSLSAGSNSYVATYTNPAGVTSTQTFTISEGTVAPGLISSYATGIDNACQSTYSECDSGGVASPSLVVYPKLAFRGGNSSTGGNNCAVLVVHFNSAYTVAGMPTDNESEAWTAGPSVTDSNTGLTMQTFYVLADTAGTNAITVTLSGTPGASNAYDYLGGWVDEFQNCGGLGGTGTLDAAATGAPLTLNLTSAPSNGDLVLGYFMAGNVDTVTPYLPYPTLTAGSGFAPLSNQLSFGKLSEYSTSTTSPSVAANYPANAGTVLGVGLSIQQGVAGTAPPATKYIDHYQVEQVDTAAPAIDFPCSGNLIVGLTGEEWGQVSSVTGSSGTWSPGVTSNNWATAQIFYGTGVTCSSMFVVNPTFSVAPPGTEIALASVSNAAGTLDTGACAVGVQQYNPNQNPNPPDYIYSVDCVSGNQLSQTPSETDPALTSVSIAPSAPNDIIFSTASISWHTLTSTVADGNGHVPTFLAAVMNAADDAGYPAPCSAATPNSTLDEDNGYAFYINSDTSPVSFIYGGSQATGSCISNPYGVLGWSAVAAAFQ
jgi:hypothetical protein